jgi:hypothetical protein
MGRRRTETSYQSEAAYLKSVLFWRQGNWAEPDPPRFYPRLSKGRGTILVGRSLPKSRLHSCGGF